ncbi:MAG TPA: hypothetical protein VHQ24_13505 [Lachnospiraceae bacterium]|nr:hypothetical protein [Lachnospiraceae bacterium]
MNRLNHENYVIIKSKVIKYDDLTYEQKERVQDSMLEKVMKEANFEKAPGKNNQNEHGKS